MTATTSESTVDNGVNVEALLGAQRSAVVVVRHVDRTRRNAVIEADADVELVAAIGEYRFVSVARADCFGVLRVDEGGFLAVQLVSLIGVGRCAGPGGCRASVR